MRVLKCQKGYTMIETIGVLAIIAVVGSSAVAFLNKAFLRYKITRLSQQVVEMQKSIDKRYAAKKTYDNLTVPVLITERLLPADMVYKNGMLYHRLKGTATVTLGENNESYTITFNAVPRNACVELAAQNWGLDQRVILDNIIIGNNKLKWKCGVGEQNCFAMPLNATQANQVCAGANNQNNISWTFY